MTTLSLRDLAFVGGRALLYPAYVQDYLDRVTAADVAAGNTSGLELGVTDAASAFLQDLVSISYLGVSSNVISQAASVIKAMPIMAGARTRAGALVPVVGPVPTEFGTAGGWSYNRNTGLAGNGTNNYLNSNRANNADPQNSCHNACWVSTPMISMLMSSSSATTGANYMDIAFAPGGVNLITRFRNRFAAATNPSTSPIALAGLYGHNRNTSTSFDYMCPQGNGAIVAASQTPDSRNIVLYARTNDGLNYELYSSIRLAFYSIGESLNLALLDARVTQLINAYAAAIA